MKRNQQGSATVELALSIPLLTLFLLLMTQVGVVMLDQLAVTQAAREAARAVAVDSSKGAAATAAGRATRLNEDRLQVSTVGRREVGEMATVSVAYTSLVTLPFTKRVLVRPVVSADASMRVEESP